MKKQNETLETLILSDLKFLMFIEDHLFENVMSCGGIDGYHNYIGEDFKGWLCGPVKTRDSEILEESNFDAALERLGRERENVIMVEHCGHWGCGWFDRILVNSKSKKATKKLYELYKDLENYPVLDEDDFSQRECEEYSRYADQEKTNLANALRIHFDLKQSQGALENLAYNLNMENQFSNGQDSCVNIYECRKPDQSDLRSLKYDLGNVKYCNLKGETLEAFNDLCKFLGMNEENAA